jgi:hypothetical protein
MIIRVADSADLILRATLSLMPRSRFEIPFGADDLLLLNASPAGCDAFGRTGKDDDLFSSMTASVNLQLNGGTDAEADEFQ